jgi:hypothetical protein
MFSSHQAADLGLQLTETPNLFAPIKFRRFSSPQCQGQLNILILACPPTVPGSAPTIFQRSLERVSFFSANFIPAPINPQIPQINYDATPDSGAQFLRVKQTVYTAILH